MAYAYDPKTGDIQEVEEASQEFHANLPKEIQDTVSVGEVDSMRVGLKKTPGLATEDDVKSEMFDPNNLDQRATFDKLARSLKARENVAMQAQQLEQSDPALLRGIANIAKNAVQAPLTLAGKAFEGLSRVLNFSVAVESGIFTGFVKSLKGEGTVLENVMSSLGESVGRNTGFEKTLSEAGVPEQFVPDMIKMGGVAGVGAMISSGDTSMTPMKPWLPIPGKSTGLAALNPGSIAWGIADDIKNGRRPIELQPFAPVLTDRGMAGFALDVLTDPVTYLSMGLNVPAKSLIKAKGAGFVVREPASVVRFMSKTVLTDIELTKGITALKATKSGQEVIHLMDLFAATKLGKNLKKITDATLSSVIPEFGRNKDVIRLGLKTEANLTRDKQLITEFVDSTLKSLTPEEKNEMFLSLFDAQKLESKYRELQLGLKEAGKIPEEVYLQNLKAYPRVKFSSEKITKAADSLISKTAEIARAAGLPEEILYNNYIPSVLEETLELGGAPRRFLTSLKGGLNSAKRKKFVLEGMSLDVEKNFARRMQELTSYRHTTNFMKHVIKKYGKDSSNLLKEGYSEFFPKSNLRFYKTVTEKGNEVLGVSRAKPVYLPNEVLKTVTDFDKSRTLPENVLLRTFVQGLDAVTAQFKGFVTSMWPAFHFRNAMSNRVLRFQNEGWKAFNFADDGDAVKLLGGIDLDKPFTLASGKQVPNRVIRKWAEEERLIGSTQYSATDLWHDVSKFGDSRVSNRVRDYLDPRVSKNNFIKIGREVGSAIEEEAKLASFVRALKDGYSRKEAADIAMAGLFDYANLTSFERNVVRRFVPFYTFSRKNIDLQVKTLLTNPGRDADIFKLVKDISQQNLNKLSDQDLQDFNELKPTFLQYGFAVPAGFKPGTDEVMWLTGFGLPQQETMELLNAQNLGFRVNPAIKLPLELFRMSEMGRKMLGIDPVALKGKYKAEEFRGMMKYLYGKDLNTREFQTWMNDPNGFQKNPLVRFMGLRAVQQPVYEKGIKTGRFETILQADPVKLEILRESFVARGMAFMKSMGNEDTEESHKFLQFMTGLNVINQSLGEADSFRNYQLEKDISAPIKISGAKYTKDKFRINILEKSIKNLP